MELFNGKNRSSTQKISYGRKSFSKNRNYLSKPKLY